MKRFARVPKLFWLFWICFFIPAVSFAEPLIRVELARAASFEISCPEDMEVRLSDGRPVFLGRSIVFQWEPGGVSLNGRFFKTDGMTIHPGAPFLWNKHHYRGDLILHKDAGDLEAVNVLPLEKYLACVVGSEVSSRWPLEALKAQAVVARTYALEKQNARGALPFDVVGDSRDQVYEGVEGESAATVQAAADTRGQVLTYEGKLIEAFYHADCGGRTENGGNVFRGGNYPYLQSVACPYERDSPYQHWSKSYTLPELSQLFGRPVRDVTIAKNSQTGRVARVILDTGGGTESLTAANFRKILGSLNLRSTGFDLEKRDAVVYVSREETLPPQVITRYVSKQILQSKPDAATRPLILRNRAYLMHDAGSLEAVDVSAADPLVAISSGGFLNAVYEDLAARAVNTRKIPEEISVPLVTTGPPRKRTVQVPLKVPVEFTFTGRGWGHGVGLCQWGARGMALLGKDYKDILLYYYQGVRLARIYE